MIHAADLAGLAPLERHRGRNWSKADVSRFRILGRDVALKDYGPRPWLVRQTLGRWLTRREVAAYERVRGLAGLPGLLGRPRPWTLALEWIEGRPLAECQRSQVPPESFAQLGAILAALHERGVALTDLHHRDVLITDGGAVYVVDLALAWRRGTGNGRLARRVFERLRQADLVALERMRLRHAGLDPRAAGMAVSRSAALWHHRGRVVKRWWDRLRRRDRGKGRSR